MTLASSLPDIWGNVAAWGSVAIALAAGYIAWRNSKAARDAEGHAKRSANIAERALAMAERSEERAVEEGERQRTKAEIGTLAEIMEMTVEWMSELTALPRRPADLEAANEEDLIESWRTGYGDVFVRMSPRSAAVYRLDPNLSSDVIEAAGGMMKSMKDFGRVVSAMRAGDGDGSARKARKGATDAMQRLFNSSTDKMSELSGGKA